MVDLKPFENVQNRTSVIFLKKGEITQYPVPYIKWTKIKNIGIKQEMLYNDILDITQKHELVASPIYPNGGPWLTVESKLLHSVKNLVGKSNYQARKGITSDLNGLYWIEIISTRNFDKLLFRNLHSIGRHEVAPFEGLIEKEVVYPIARGRDSKPFYITESKNYVIIPQDGMRGYPEEIMIKKYPLALSYFRKYSNQLKKHSSYKRYHLDKNKKELGPYYSLWNVGSYSFAMHKVAWREVQNTKDFFVSYIGPTTDPILGQVPVIPDHKLYFVPCGTAEEAYYLTGYLNSNIVKSFVDGYAISTQIGTHVTEYINIPQFNLDDDLHKEISLISSRICNEKRDATIDEIFEIDKIVELILLNYNSKD